MSRKGNLESTFLALNSTSLVHGKLKLKQYKTKVNLITTQTTLYCADAPKHIKIIFKAMIGYLSKLTSPRKVNQ